jgi:CHAT domain-containing protein/tetratricopeptide (TPR) repeat protein
MHDEGFHGWISFDCGSEMEDAIPAAHYTRALRRHTDIYHRVGSYGDSAVIKYFSYTLLVWLLFVGYSTAFATPARNKLRVSENLAETAARWSTDSITADPSQPASVAIRRPNPEDSSLTSDWKKEVRDLNETAYGLERKARWDEAVEVLTRAERIANDHSGAEGEETVRTLNLLGYVYLYLDRPREAQTCLLRALNLAARYSGIAHPLSSDTHYLLGLNYQRIAVYDSAVICFSRALQERRESGTVNEPGSIGVLLGLGNAEAALEAYTTAEGHFNEALALIKQSGLEESYEGATCYHGLARLYTTRADMEKAVRCEERALQITRNVFGELHPTVPSSFISLGDLYCIQGDFERSAEYYGEAANLLRTLGSSYSRQVAWAEQKLASAYGEAGQLYRARKTCEGVLAALREELGELHPDVASAHSDLGFLLLKAGFRVEARAQFDSALTIYGNVSAGNRDARGRLYAEVACLLPPSSPERTAAIDSSSRMLSTPGDHSVVEAAGAYRRLGDACAGTDAERAMRYYQRALKVLCPTYSGRESGDNPEVNAALNGKELLETLLAKARLLERMHGRRRGDAELLEASLRTFEEAAVVVASLRNIYRSEQAKLDLGSQAVNISEHGIEASLKRYRQTGREEYFQKALWFSDGCKAGVLLEGVAGAQARKRAGIPESLLSEEKNLADAVSYLERRILQAGNDDGPNKMKALSTRLFARHRQLDSLWNAMTKSYPELLVAMDPQQTLDVPAIQADLEQNTALLEYFCGGKSITLFLIQKERVRVFRLARPRDFDDLVHTYLWASRTADSRAFMSSSSRLCDILVRPALGFLRGMDHLIIVPDDILSSIPFESLISKHDAGKSTDYGDADYLIGSHAISYAYSAAHWMSKARTGEMTERKEGETFVGFAPVFGDSVRNGYLASSTISRLKRDENLFRSVTVDGKRFAELPYSQVEISSIAREFSQRGEPCATYLHTAATKEAFEKAAENARFVHLATHGIVSEAHPELSALVFSQPADTASADNGTLYSDEICDLRLNADLLVISSCESGVGKLVPGEGTMAVTRGFFQAGVKNVVVSLWKVLDQPTATLMLRFYQNIIKGYSYPKALRAAKLSMIRNPLTAAPAIWASFILIGN